MLSKVILYISEFGRLFINFVISEPVNCPSNINNSNIEKPDISFENRLHHYQQILACPLIDINVEFADYFEKCLKYEGINMVEFYRGSFDEFQNETLPIIKEKYCPHYDKLLNCLDFYFKDVNTCLDGDNTHFGIQGYQPIKAIITYVCEEGNADLLRILNKDGQDCMDKYRPEIMSCGTSWDEAWQSKMPFLFLPFLYIDSEVERLVFLIITYEFLVIKSKNKFLAILKPFMRVWKKIIPNAIMS